MLVDHDKQFLILGNNNAITYKEIFPLLKNNQMWLGALGWSEELFFNVTDEYKQYLVENKKEGSAYVIRDGVVMARAACMWYTNMDLPKRHERLDLWKHYTPEEFPAYENFNAINVDQTSNIPVDYDGIMGVPISFLDKYNPEQFEIIDCTHTSNPILLTETHPTSYYREFKRGKVVTSADPSMPLTTSSDCGGTKCVRNSDGAIIYQLYHRLFIRRKASA